MAVRGGPAVGGLSRRSARWRSECGGGGGRAAGGMASLPGQGLAAVCPAGSPFTSTRACGGEQRPQPFAAGLSAQRGAGGLRGG